MLDRFRYAWLWSKAIRFASIGRTGSSLELVDKLSRYYPKTVAPDVFRLGLRVASEDYKFVFENADAVSDRVLREKSDGDERRYVLAYISWLKGIASHHSVKPFDSHPSSALAIDWKTINLSDVPRQIKRMFPLRIHPDWRPSDGKPLFGSK